MQRISSAFDICQLVLQIAFVGESIVDVLQFYRRVPGSAAAAVVTLAQDDTVR